MICLDCGKKVDGQTSSCPSCFGKVITTQSIKKVWQLEDSDDFGKYILIERIAKTSTSDVYQALDKQLGRTVAIKVLQEPYDNPERFKREGRIAALLNHINICHIYEIGDYNGKLFIAMQYIDGTTIDRKKLTIREAVEFTKQAAAVLHYAHEQGVIHRDIKPQNILIDNQGRLFITDFGIAKIKGSHTLTREDVVLGTPVYMSPEQTISASRELDHATDVYSLGATLYCLVTGVEPFKHKEVHKLFKSIQVDDPVPPSKINKQISKELEAVILKSMEKNKKARYKTALEFAEDLQRFLDGEAVQARPTPALIKYTRKLMRKPATWIPTLIAFILLSILTINFVFVLPHTTKKQEEVQLRLTELQLRISEAEKMTFSSGWDRERFRELVDSAILELEKTGVNHPHANYLLGECYRLKGKNEIAIQYFTKAINRIHDFTAAYYSRGRCYVRLYTFMQTFKECSVKFVDPKELDRIKNQALRDLENAKMTASKSDLEFVNALSLYMEGKLNAAMKLVNDAEKTIIEDAKFFTLKGFIFFELQKIIEAEKSFRQAINVSPNYVYAHIGLATLFLAKNDLIKSIGYFDTSIAIAPEDSILYLQRAYVKIIASDLDGAIKDLNRTLELDKEMYLARILIAGIYINKKDLKTAQKHIDEVKQQIDKKTKPEEKSEKAYLEVLLGWFYLESADTKKAEAYFASAVKSDPNLIEAKWAELTVKFSSRDIIGLLQKSVEIIASGTEIKSPRYLIPFKRGLIFVVK